MARPEGLEPSTPGLEGRSVLLITEVISERQYFGDVATSTFAPSYDAGRGVWAGGRRCFPRRAVRSIARP